MPVQEAMIWRNIHSQARLPRFGCRFEPLPIKIFANWIGELSWLSSARAIISRYSRSISSGLALCLRMLSNTSRASSFRPTEARNRGLSGSILMKQTRITAGTHWKASKNRHRTSEYPLLMNARPNDIQYATEIPRSERG